MKSALNAIRKANDLPPLSPAEWFAKVKKEAQAVDLATSFLQRSLNSNFSGGEKKRNELLQMRLLDPTLSILDETDSGLDTHALKLMIATIKEFQKKNKTLLIITHYPSLIEELAPDVVHLMHEGTIISSGDAKFGIATLSSGYQKLEATS